MHRSLKQRSGRSLDPSTGSQEMFKITLEVGETRMLFELD